MLPEAIHVIRELWTGELSDRKGEYFQVDSARMGFAGGAGRHRRRRVRSGEKSVQTFAPLPFIAVEPQKDLVDAWHDARRTTGLMLVCLCTGVATNAVNDANSRGADLQRRGGRLRVGLPAAADVPYLR